MRDEKDPESRGREQRHRLDRPAPTDEPSGPQRYSDRGGKLRRVKPEQRRRDQTRGARVMQIVGKEGVGAEIDRAPAGLDQSEPPGQPAMKVGEPLRSRK